MHQRKYFTLNFFSMKYFLSKNFQTTVVDCFIYCISLLKIDMEKFDQLLVKIFPTNLSLKYSPMKVIISLSHLILMYMLYLSHSFLVKLMHYPVFQYTVYGKTSIGKTFVFWMEIAIHSKSFSVAFCRLLLLIHKVIIYMKRFKIK